MYGADGSVTYAASYDPYGAPFEQFGLNQTAFGFTGEQTDDNGLQYLRARYYNPNTGTFLSHNSEKHVLSSARASKNAISPLFLTIF